MTGGIGNVSPTIAINALETHAELIRTELRMQLQSGPVQADWLEGLLGQGTLSSCGLLLLLAGEAADADHEALLAAAVAMELLGASVRLHDGIPSGPKVRPLAHAPYDTEEIGDYLLARALRIVSTLPRKSFRTFAELLEGLMDAKIRGGQENTMLHVSEQEYLERTYAKSAVLLATACKMGAGLGSAEASVVEALTAFGYAVGMAWQIREDWLACGSEGGSGETPLFLDIDLAQLPLPVVHSLQHSARTRSLFALQAPAATRWAFPRHPLLRCLQESGSLDYSADLARTYVLKAKASLAGLPASLPKCLLLDAANTLLEPLE